MRAGVPEAAPLARAVAPERKGDSSAISAVRVDDCCCCCYITWKLGEGFNTPQATTDQNKEGEAKREKEEQKQATDGVHWATGFAPKHEVLAEERERMWLARVEELDGLHGVPVLGPREDAALGLHVGRRSLLSLIHSDVRTRGTDAPVWLPMGLLNRWSMEG